MSTPLALGDPPPRHDAVLHLDDAMAGIPAQPATCPAGLGSAVIDEVRFEALDGGGCG